MDRPLLGLACIAAVGCGVGAQGVANAVLLLVLASAACVLALMARPAWSAAALAAASLGVSAAAAGAENARREQAGLEQFVSSPRDDVFEVSGVALADFRLLEGRGELLMAVEWVRDARPRVPMSGRARLSIGGGSPVPTILEGDRVRVWTTLRAPRGHATPGARDSMAEARREGVGAFGYCKSARLLQVDARGRQVLPRVRDAARAQIARFVQAGPEQGLVRAMVLGDRAGLDRATLDAFRASGTYHVLALSGAQVAMVAWLLLVALRRLGASPTLIGPLVSVVLFAYAALVGADPPVVRAAIMAAVVLLGRSLELDGDVANLLGLAALLLLLRTPSDVGDPGFQLSFVATLGLVLLTQTLRSLLPRLPLGLDLALASSLAAQLALAPLLVVHFHRLAPAALALNLVAVPLATAVLVSGAVLVVASSVVPALGGALGAVAWLAAHALLLSGRALDFMPFLDVRTPDPLAAIVAVHVVGVALLVIGRRGPGLLVSAFGLLGLAWGGPESGGRGGLEVTFLDVGQGDAIVLRSPSGRHLLVDAGGSFDDRFDVAESVVGPFLWHRRARELDLFMLSHAHPDHVGGAPGVLRSFRVGEAWEGPAPRADPWYGALDVALDAAGVARRTVWRGVGQEWDGVCLELLGPRAPAKWPLSTRNDDSLLLRASYGSVSFLLTGDAEAIGEGAVPAGAVSVLKVAHHGSRTSTTPGLLAATRPQIAVISVGDRNPFGHPAPEVLDRLRASGVRVFRTDRDGAVVIDTDGANIRVRTTRSLRDESVRAVMQLRGSVDVLPSPTCPTF